MYGTRTCSYGREHARDVITIQHEYRTARMSRGRLILKHSCTNVYRGLYILTVNAYHFSDFLTVNASHLSRHIPFLKEVTSCTRTTSLFGRGYIQRIIPSRPRPTFKIQTICEICYIG